MSKLVPKPKREDFDVFNVQDRYTFFLVADRDYYKAVSEHAIEALKDCIGSINCNEICESALADIKATQGDV